MSEKEASQVLTSENAAEFYANRLGLAESPAGTEAVEETPEPVDEETQSEPKEAEKEANQEGERKQNPKLEKRFSEITKQREEARKEAQNERQARLDLEQRLAAMEQQRQPQQAFNVDTADIVVGIAASGTTPYVIEGLKKCRSEGIATACVTCNPQSLLAEVSDFPVEIITGPEFVTGSTRMKAGTAQKLALNMISTSVMIQRGRVLDNIMVDMQLSNHKLIDRGIKMIMKQLNVSYPEANNLLQKHGNVRNVLNNHAQNLSVNS